MKILLTSIGTRGDMEPFLAIAELLKRNGHEVVCLFPEQFRSMAEDSGFRFVSLGTRFLDMLHSDAGKAAMGGGGSGLKKFWAYLKLAMKYQKINKELVHRQYEVIEAEKPDRIVCNPKVVYPVIWGIKHPGKTIIVSPVPYLHYVKGHTHLGFNSDLGEFLNKRTFDMANFGLVSTIMTSAKWLGLSAQVSRKAVRQVLNSCKTIYTMSPSLFPRPEEWPENLQVLGYHERNKTVNWSPDAELEQFLERHEKILLITFGSMTNPAPEKKTKVILDLLEKHQIPALISTGEGGLVKPAQFNTDLVHFVSQIPYDWVLPKIYGMVHHGGSGTTHMGLKHGCATLIVPHIIDQFVWNKMIADLGAGPKGVRIDKLATKTFEPLLLELYSNPAYKEKAEQIAARMSREEYEDALCSTIVQ